MGKLMDTGRCMPESRKTLLVQQQQLIAGKRPAQMFPIGTAELPLPTGMARYQNHRGIFHYDPLQVSAGEVAACSRNGRENEILMLGPFSKPEIAHRVIDGENPICVIEETPNGLEIRSAAGTDETAEEQIIYFEATKDDPSNVVKVMELLPVIMNRLAN